MTFVGETKENSSDSHSDGTNADRFPISIVASLAQKIPLPISVAKSDETEFPWVKPEDEKTNSETKRLVTTREQIRRFEEETLYKTLDHDRMPPFFKCYGLFYLDRSSVEEGTQKSDLDHEFSTC